MGKCRILFIDDDESLQILAKAMMDSGIFDVISAKSASAAEQTLTSQSVDVLVVDVMMPGEDGIKFTRRLRAGGNKTPILILSAISDPKIMRQALEAGATEYIVKPFDIHELQKKLVFIARASNPRKSAPSKELPQKSSGFFGWLKR